MQMADLTRVQQAVQSLAATTGVRDLNARANGELIEIHGTVRSIAEKQSVMRAITEKVGDMGIRNLLQVAADTGAQPQPSSQLGMGSLGRGGPAIGVTHAAETSQQNRTHKVAKGETLSHLAQRYYGKASEFQKIFNANRDQLNDPDKVREGMELKIPT
jgi:LysM repeat protein